jgi:hypothetical protein
VGILVRAIVFFAQMCELCCGRHALDRAKVRIVWRHPENGSSHVSAQIRAPGRIDLIAALRAAGATIALATLVACQQGHESRTVSDFREDGLARDGVLARCNHDAAASQHDVECDKARRAAAVAAADPDAERTRSTDLARQSERKMLAMRERDSREQQAEVQAAADERAHSDAEYEAQWRDQNSAGKTASVNDADADFDFVSARPLLKVAAVAPPASDLTIVAPELQSSDVAIPRPFRAVSADKGAQPPP